MAQYHFCPMCGTPLGDTDRYCPNCGAKLDGAADFQQQPDRPPPTGSYRRGTIPRMLAYIPGLFWAPVAVDSTDHNNRECANQGLLLLLYCIVLSILFSMIGILLAYLGVYTAIGGVPANPAVPYTYSYPYTGFDGVSAFFNQFGAMFYNFGQQFQPTGSRLFSGSFLGSLMSILYTVFALYVPVNSIWGLIHCINHDEPHILPFIGRIKIIKSW